MEIQDMKFDTKMLHAGATPDPATGSRQVPIYQNIGYVFKDVDHAARLFNLQELGYIYTRLTNPTVAALQERITHLEGGVGAVACSSGHSAQIMALFAIMRPGDNIVASNRLYGGTVTQFSHTIKRFGWSATFVDTENLAAVEAAADENTKAIFCESLANPGGYATDIAALVEVANRLAVPLIVDNTSATPYLCRPFEQGAHLVVHSTTKFLTGNGTSLGGVVVDSGSFDWSATAGKYPALTEPEPAYHGMKFHESFGNLAFTFHGIAIGLRDLGMTMAPQNAFQTLLGIETLSLRMQRHVENAVKVAGWLETDHRIESVSYAGLPSSPYYGRVQEMYPKGAGALFTVAVKGGYDACVKLVNNLELFSHVANLGDARSLIIHSASTTHRQLTEEQQIASGALPNVVRISIGLEDSIDLIADLDQALTKATQ